MGVLVTVHACVWCDGVFFVCLHVSVYVWMCVQVHSPLLQYILRQRHGYEGITVYVWGISKDVLTSKSSYTEHMKRIIAKGRGGDRPGEGWGQTRGGVRPGEG